MKSVWIIEKNENHVSELVAIYTDEKMARKECRFLNEDEGISDSGSPYGDVDFSVSSFAINIDVSNFATKEII